MIAVVAIGGAEKERPRAALHRTGCKLIRLDSQQLAVRRNDTKTNGLRLFG